jgi:hypothetical protein
LGEACQVRVGVVEGTTGPGLAAEPGDSGRGVADVAATVPASGTQAVGSSVELLGRQNVAGPTEALWGLNVTGIETEAPGLRGVPENEVENAEAPEPVICGLPMLKAALPELVTVRDWLAEEPAGTLLNVRPALGEMEMLALASKATVNVRFQLLAPVLWSTPRTCSFDGVKWTPLSRPFFARNKLMPTGPGFEFGQR